MRLCRLTRPRLLVLVALTAFLVTEGLFEAFHHHVDGDFTVGHWVQDHMERRRTNSSWTELVCIVGAASDVDSAWATHLMWGNVIPSVWYVNGDSGGREPVHSSRMAVIAPSAGAQPLPWAAAVAAALAEARRRYRCHYVFVHGEDAQVYLPPSSPWAGSTIATVLSDFLMEYRPAVASFVWDDAGAALPGVQALHRHYEREPAAPLTHFDTHMVIYHHDVVDLFLPNSTADDGGGAEGRPALLDADDARWTLYAQFFVPLLFREHAVLLTSLHYKCGRGIGPDNVRARLAAYDRASDAPAAVAYRNLLPSGLRERRYRWGTNLTAADIAWEVAAGQREYAPEWVRDRLIATYDPRHNALQGMPLRRLVYDDADGAAALAAAQASQVTIHLHLLVFVSASKDAAEGLARLWNSLMAQDLPDRDVVGPYLIHIRLFRRVSRSPTVSDRQLAPLKKLQCSFAAEVTTHAIAEDLRDRDYLVSAWRPPTVDDFALVLDDFVELSPHALQLVLTTLRHEYYGPERQTALLGVSLGAPPVDELRPWVWQDHYAPPHAAAAGGDSGEVVPLLTQQVAAFGTVFSPEGWRALLRWMETTEWVPVMPGLLANWVDRGPRVLQRYVSRFAAIRGLVTLGWVLPGAPGVAAVAFARDHATSVSDTPEVDGGVGPRYLATRPELVRTIATLRPWPEALVGVAVLDSHFRPAGANPSAVVAALPPLREAYAADRCSLLIHHVGTEAALHRLLAYMRHVSGAIVGAVLWSGSEGDDGGLAVAASVRTELSPEDTGLAPAGDAQPGSTPLPVFRPADYGTDGAMLGAVLPTLKTNCVMAVDTASYLLSRDALRTALTLWRTDLPHQLIGARRGSWTHLAGGRASSPTPRRWRVSPDVDDAVSIVGTELMVFPVSLLRHAVGILRAAAAAAADGHGADEAGVPPQAVWRQCRGVLMSAVAALVTGQGAAVVDNMDDAGPVGPAGSRIPVVAVPPTEAELVRLDACLARVAEVMDVRDLPLLHTTSFLPIPQHWPITTRQVPRTTYSWTKANA